MAGQGYRAPAQAIIKCGGNVSGMTSHADTIKQKTSEAEVPELSWGMLGMATTYSSYRDLLERFTTHLDQIRAGISKAGNDISECGRHYMDTDKQIAENLQKISGDMGGMKA